MFTGILGASPLGRFELAFVPPGLVLLQAQPIAENVVRLRFNEAMFFSGILEPDDASAGAHYSISIVPGTIGRDGLPTRRVTPVFAELDLAFDPSGAALDVFLDRPMSPSPGGYVISVRGLSRATDRTPMSPDPQSAAFEALFREFVPPDATSAIPSRDFANPQDGTAQKTPTAPILGTFNVDAAGDYAIDEGLASLKKRIIRRLVTSVNGFQHLPGFGVGITTHGKRLASASTRQKIASLAQAQILLEPEVSSCTVTTITPESSPGLVFFVVRVQTSVGQQFRLAVPFPVT